jgi:hypothetical protein
VTHARATPAAVGVERWGGETPDGPLIFTVMNRSTKPVTAEITLDLGALHLAARDRVFDLIAGQSARSKTVENQRVHVLDLGPEQATALELQE